MKTQSPNNRRTIKNQSPRVLNKRPPQPDISASKQQSKKFFKTGNPFFNTPSIRSTRNSNQATPQISYIMPATSKMTGISQIQYPKEEIIKYSPKSKPHHRSVKSQNDLLKKNCILKPSTAKKMSIDQNFRFQVTTKKQKRASQSKRSRTTRINKEDQSSCSIKKHNKSQKESAKSFQAPRLFDNQIFDYKQDGSGNNVDIDLIDSNEIESEHPLHLLYLPKHIKMDNPFLTKQTTVNKRIHNVTPEQTTMMEQTPQFNILDLQQLIQRLNEIPKIQKNKTPSPV